MSQVVRFSRGSHSEDNTPSQREADDFAQFRDMVLSDQAATKGRQWISAACAVAPDDELHREGGSNGSFRRAIGKHHRCMACVQPRRFIALDLDGVEGPEAFAELQTYLHIHGHSAFGWTTHSHKLDKPRARFIVEADREMSREECARASIALQARIHIALGGPEARDRFGFDETLNRPEQPIFLPPKVGERFIYEGVAISVDALLAEAPSAAVVSVAPVASLGTRVTTGRHDAILKETLFLAQGVANGHMTRGEAVSLMCDRRASGRYTRHVPDDEIVRALDGALAKTKPQPAANDDVPPEDGERELDLDAVCSEPPERRQVVEGVLPVGHPALLAADGGVGKTLLSHQLATSVAAGVDWLGRVSEPGPVLAYYCEDPIDELWRRQRGICRQFGIDPQSLKGRLHVRSRIGLDNALMSFDARDKHAKEHPLLWHIEAEVARIKPKLLILDNLAQMFMGDLSDTALVTQFANRMARIALRDECAVLMSAHTPKSGAEFYGAVAWNNAVRVRFFMEAEVEPDPNNPARTRPTGRTFFSRPKANYGQRTGAVILRWHDEAFVRDDQPRSFAEHVVASDRMREVDETLLQGLATLTERRIGASHNGRAGNYLPKLLEKHELSGGISRKELGRALDRLVMSRRVDVDVQLWQRGNRSWVSGLRVVGEE